MNSKFFAFAFTFIHLGTVFAQVSLNAKFGYSFPWAVDDIPEGNIFYFEDGSREVELVKASLGSGMNYTFSILHPIKKDSKVSFGVDISYFNGKDVAILIKSSLINIRTTYGSKMLWICPVLKANLNNKKVSPYLSLSPSIGLFGEISEGFIGNPYGHELIEINSIYSKGLAYGINTILGIQGQFFKNSHLGILIEINSMSSSFGPKRGEIVKSLKDGISNLEEMGMNKVTLFKNKHIKDATLPNDLSKPLVATRRYYPFSSLGLTIGIRILLI
jgi:hypothetical protein